MSVTFSIAVEITPGFFDIAEDCDCLDAWDRARIDAEARGEETPDLFSCEVCRAEINISNVNARSVIAWLGLPDDDLCGAVPARELAARCRRRLWDEPRNHDPALPGGVEVGALGALLVDGGRPAGYLRRQVERLLALAERAGDRFVSWG